MKGRIAALLVIAVFLLPVAGLIASEDAEAAPEYITFTGIVEYNDQPIKGAEVHLVWSVKDSDSGIINSRLIGIGWTDDNGEFSVTIYGSYDSTFDNFATIYCFAGNILISKEGEFSDPISKKVNLGDITDFPQGWTPQPEITVLGSVKYEGISVEGAKVTLVNAMTNKEIIFDNTDKQGAYELKWMPGNYYITIERGGFFDWESPIFELGESNSKILDATLTVSPETTYFGLDLPHILTVFGLFLALILLIAVVIYVMWAKRHPGQIRIIDDSPDE